MDYITISDVKHVHFRQFPTDTKEAYIDEANDYYEDFAESMGVGASELISPICQTSKRLLINYTLVRFAEDSIGTNNISLAEGEDMYVNMYQHYHSTLQQIKSQITPEMLTGNVSNRVGRTVSFGKRMRS